MSELQEWLVTYLKNRDLMLHRIVELHEGQDSVHVKFKDKEQDFLILPELRLPELARLHHPSLVCFNTQANLDFLIKNWAKLAAIKTLSVYFVNPKSIEQKWIIFPHTHHSITENLELGLKSMFDSVGGC